VAGLLMPKVEAPIEGRTPAETRSPDPA